jgi:erythrin-vacuolar iron transport family protein
MNKFSDLTEREVLAVAIASEEDDGRIYMSFAENLAERYPESGRIFEQMAEEEKGHRHMLLELYERRFGPNLPPIRREDVKEAGAQMPNSNDVAGIGTVVAHFIPW